MEREPILVEREKTHGVYAVQATWAQDMKADLRRPSGWRKLEAGQRESLEMIATKIARILHGDPKHEDSWADIAGYAKLGQELCKEPVPFR